jgi:hypothetical protein
MIHLFRFRRPVLFRLILAALFFSALPAFAAEDPRLEQSREIVKAFAGQLQAELKAAMGAGGPAAAIHVCKDVAPAVASQLSRKHGAQVVRTSLRVRNTANLPADWQVEVLREFDERADEAGDGPLEYFETRRDGRFRYMKAIPTGGVCVACHGGAVSDDVRQLLDEHYPHDRACGYAPGDIRGAFSIVWPEQSGPDE